MHPACPNKKQNHLQNSLLRLRKFWVRKTFWKPASLKRASLVGLPVAISDKVAIETKTLRSFNIHAKTLKNMNLNTVSFPCQHAMRPDDVCQGSLALTTWISLIWFWRSMNAMNDHRLALIDHHVDGQTAGIHWRVIEHHHGGIGGKLQPHPVPNQGCPAPTQPPGTCGKLGCACPRSGTDTPGGMPGDTPTCHGRPGPKLPGTPPDDKKPGGTPWAPAPRDMPGTQLGVAAGAVIPEAGWLALLDSPWCWFHGSACG